MPPVVSSQDSVVVVGSGHGGTQLAICLRQDGYEGRGVVIGEERGLPHQRPPLSKDFLAGRVEQEGIAFRPFTFFDSKRIELIEGAVVEIDRDRKAVVLADGTRVEYSTLVLACGAANRALTVPGAELEGVMPLRTLADAHALRSALEHSSHAVVVGAGFMREALAVTDRFYAIERGRVVLRGNAENEDHRRQLADAIAI